MEKRFSIVIIPLNGETGNAGLGITRSVTTPGSVSEFDAVRAIVTDLHRALDTLKEQVTDESVRKMIGLSEGAS